MKKELGYEVNYAGKEITLSKVFYKKASAYGSNEYNSLKGLMTDYPDYKLIIRKISNNSKKKTYAKLTYERMANYIVFLKVNTIEVPEEQRKAILKDFELKRREATFKNSPYAYMKKWFFAQYPNFTSENIQINEKENAKSESPVAEAE